MDIGELAAVTVSNDQCPELNGSSAGGTAGALAAAAADGTATTVGGELRKTWTARYILK